MFSRAGRNRERVAILERRGHNASLAKPRPPSQSDTAAHSPRSANAVATPSGSLESNGARRPSSHNPMANITGSATRKMRPFWRRPSQRCPPPGITQASAAAPHAEQHPSGCRPGWRCRYASSPRITRLTTHVTAAPSGTAAAACRCQPDRCRRTPQLPCVTALAASGTTGTMTSADIHTSFATRKLRASHACADRPYIGEGVPRRVIARRSASAGVNAPKPGTQLLLGQPQQSIQPEVLHREGRQRAPRDDGAGDNRRAAVTGRGKIPHEPTGKCVPGAGRVTHILERHGWPRRRTRGRVSSARRTRPA